MAAADEPAPAPAANPAPAPAAEPAPAAPARATNPAPPAPAANPAPAPPANPAPANPPAPSAEESEFFERQIRPLLAEHCLKCHGPKKQEAGLRLDSRPALVKGSDSGPVVTLGDPAAGKLITAIGYADENLQMPPDGKLPPEAIAALTDWIKRGLPWPEGAGEIAAQADPEAWRRHWAFQPIGDPALPAVQHADWVQCANSMLSFWPGWRRKVLSLRRWPTDGHGCGV